MIKIKLKRSYIGIPEKQRRVLRALGLRKIGATVTKTDDPIFRGMIYKVQHLIEVSEE
ncbi:50S ribosomal protein L30 [bacterium BMS3Abin07]|nr:50S ribosomal protein L30 [bacterium BMS3Abin07]GBE33369.1 50S ribosomal protein L30 [bacterium BMS3Bbin05]HDL20449.1 50S ribosomal protein L30 [Nitrospirota bacterium]HDO21920.1 50S ribosomal protein L30 [Nitrospirota bacterium]HDZ87990.1 50S ribosomal protein L30 [Nitrospirota bacterium]